MFWRNHALMDVAGEGGAPSGGDGGAAPAASAPAAAPAAPAPAATPAAPAPSALAGGSAEPAAPAPTGAAPDFIADKFRVTKADGSLDLDASSRKLAEAYGQLEKRAGSGDVPPKASTEYQVTVPDALKDTLGDLSQDKSFTEFRDQMHGLGLTQKQFEGVMSRYFELAPALAAGGQQVSAEQATEQLRQTWQSDADFKKNVGLSFRAASKIAEAAGMSYDDVEKAGLGNNPTFIKLMAAIGPEFSEDSLPNDAKSNSFASDDEIKQLMMSEANTNTKHPQHKATRARIDAFYARKYGTQPIA